MWSTFFKTGQCNIVQRQIKHGLSGKGPNPPNTKELHYYITFKDSRMINGMLTLFRNMKSLNSFYSMNN